MHRTAKTLALTLTAGTLMGVTPAQTYSPEQLALFDPTTRVASLCGGSRGSQSMRARLTLAAAVVGVQARAAVPSLDGGLGKIALPDHHRQSRGAASTSPRASASPTASTTPARSPPSAKRSGSIPACAMCWWGEAHGPRAQHQRADGCERECARGRGRSLCAMAGGQGDPGRAGARPTRWSSAIRSTPTPTAPRSMPLMPTRCWRPPPRIPPTTTSPCSPPKRRWTPCRGIIGSPTAARRSPGSAMPSSWSKRCWRAIPTIRRRRISTSI